MMENQLQPSRRSAAPLEHRRLCEAMARRVGQEITLETAKEIVREAMTLQLAPQVLPQKPTREQIERFEQYLLQFPQVETPTTHHFAPGLYIREMFIPAGTFLTGAVHKTEHCAVFVGDITVWTEAGMTRLSGYHRIVSKPGAKRVGYAHADTWCTGFFPTDKTDVAELEADLCETPHLLLCNRQPQVQTALEE
jgi:hypothetical protein